MRAALALLVTAGVAIGAGILGFQAGVASNIGTAGGTVVLGGFHVFGPFLFLGFVFFSFLALAAIFSGRRHHRGPWGMHGAMGPGGYGKDGPFPPYGPFAGSRREWLAELHRSLHEEETGNGGTTPGGTTGTTAA